MNTNEITAKATNGLLAMFILFTVLPVKLNYSSIVIICLTVLSIFQLFFNRQGNHNSKKAIFILSIPFFIYLIGLINTTNLTNGLNFVSRNASFLAFPFIFYCLGMLINQKLIWNVFLIGLFLTNSYLLYLFVYYFNFGEKFYMIITTDIYHSTYLGMYNLVAYFVCIQNYRTLKSRFYLLISVFFIGCAIISSARIIFLLAVISILFTLFILIEKRTKKIILVLFTAISATGILILVPSIGQKFKEIIEIEELGFDNDNYRSISSRFGKLEASIQVIKIWPLFGAGTGDITDELVVEYKKMGFTMGYKYQYNPHNQYLDNIIRNGIVGGGLCLLIFFFYPLYKSIRHKDFLTMSFVLVVAGVCLTESVLDVHKGITFYSFFLTVLMRDKLI